MSSENALVKNEKQKTTDVHSSTIIIQFQLKNSLVSDCIPIFRKQIANKLGISIKKVYVNDNEHYTILFSIHEKANIDIEGMRKRLRNSLEQISNLSVTKVDIHYDGIAYPEKLYLYRRWGNNTRDIIRYNQFYLTDPKDFNDPFDCHLQIYDNTVKEFGKSIGVRCFSKKFDDILMWSHYADSHRGICIEFTTRYLLDYALIDGEPCGIFKVNYVDKKPEPTADMYIDKRRYTSYKYCEWCYEHEYRLIHGTKQNQFFHFRPEAISKIYIGCKADSASVEQILMVIDEANRYRCSKSNKIKIEKMKEDIRTYKLSPENIEKTEWVREDGTDYICQYH